MSMVLYMAGREPAFITRTRNVRQIEIPRFLALIRGVIHRSLPVFGAFPVARVDALKSLNLIRGFGVTA
jgi:hypothetical protein